MQNSWDFFCAHCENSPLGVLRPTSDWIGAACSDTAATDTISKPNTATIVFIAPSDLFSLRNSRRQGYQRRMALSPGLWNNRCMTEAKKTPPVPRPATTVLLVRPSVPGESTSSVE